MPQQKMSKHTLASPQDSQSELETQRLDIWLFRTRLLKTRALASQTIQKGRVRVMRGGVSERVSKPHKKIRAGDVLTFMRNRHLINIEVLSTPHRRGPASEAHMCYQTFETERSEHL